MVYIKLGSSRPDIFISITIIVTTIIIIII